MFPYVRQPVSLHRSRAGALAARWSRRWNRPCRHAFDRVAEVPLGATPIFTCIQDLAVTASDNYAVPVTTGSCDNLAKPLRPVLYRNIFRSTGGSVLRIGYDCRSRNPRRGEGLADFG